jgi:DNA-binding NtrC family response regulator
MISGPAGSGKELAARLIHRNSLRENGPFIVVNAATIAPDQMESALFGEEDSQGRTTRIGLFEKAHTGTLLLDIGDLVTYFTNRIADSSGLTPRTFSAEAMAVLQSMDWPGNIRQLRNVVERILILSPSDSSRPVSVDELPRESSGIPGDVGKSGSAELVGLSLRDAREQFEREYLALQITRFNGNISRTAEFIGMERSALHRKLKALGVNSNLTRQDG